MLKGITKKDGTVPDIRAIDGAIANFKSDLQWHGEEGVAGGRLQAFTIGQVKHLVALVFKQRGTTKVTIPYCKKVCDSYAR